MAGRWGNGRGVKEIVSTTREQKECTECERKEMNLHEASWREYCPERKRGKFGKEINTVREDQ